MNVATALAWIFALALLVGVVGAARRYLLWRRGAPAHPPLLRGLLSLPKRYLVDVHDVVARDRFNARMHASTAGGFVLSLCLALCVVFLTGYEPIVLWALRAALLLMLLGAAMAVYRRRKRRAASLSGGAYDRLPLALAAFALGALIATWLPPASAHPAHDLLGFFSVVLIAAGLGALVLGPIGGGAMKHALAGALHLAWHPRPERFAAGGAGRSALLPLELGGDRFGVRSVEDFPWNRRLGFDACVECGRCEAACPAFAAGQPLNPKKLVQDLVIGMTGPGTDARYRGNPHPGSTPGSASGAPDAAIVPDLIRAETLWSCTTCRACVHECPMMIEHVDAIIDMRRCLTMERGATPEKAADALEELRLTDNPAGREPRRRLDWAVDLRLPVLGERGECDVLLWVGDAAFDRRNQQTLRAVVTLLRKAAVDFAVLGEEELDCGDVARRLGDDALFQSLAARNIATLARYRFSSILTADPHALHCLRNEYPALGGRYTVVHHTAFLNELLGSGRLGRGALGGRRITYHDPCYLARYNGEVDAPRALVRALGGEVAEMQRAGLTARCCGGGGGAPLADIPGERRIPDMRMQDALETRAELVMVSCPNCMTMLEGVVQPRPAVVDAAELLLEALERDSP